MMKKILLSFLALFLIGVLTTSVFAYRNITKEPPVVVDQTPRTTEIQNSIEEVESLNLNDSFKDEEINDEFIAETKNLKEDENDESIPEVKKSEQKKNEIKEDIFENLAPQEPLEKNVSPEVEIKTEQEENTEIPVIEEVVVEETVNFPIKKLSGDFTKIDFLHQASGQAVVYETETGPELSFENFSSVVGPDLFVYVSKNNVTKENRDLGDYASLGKLQSLKGAQTYMLPENYEEYKSVVIWCRAFDVLFSSAELN